jgi:nitrate reductase (NAD(P)H)
LSSDLKTDAPAPPSTSTDPDAPFLEPKIWKAVKLVSIQRINHDSLIYRFTFPDGSDARPLGLPVGQHVFVRLKRRDNGEVVQRAYTPVSREGAKGAIEFLVK